MAKGGKRLTDKSSLGQKPLAGKRTQQKGLIIPQEDKGLPFITFSFKYFGQQDFFGIGEQDATWFANLFDRIKDLSGKTKAIIENPTERDARLIGVQEIVLSQLQNCHQFHKVLRIMLKMISSGNFNYQKEQEGLLAFSTRIQQYFISFY